MLLELKKYKKPYRELSFTSRIKRTDEICSLIIAACIDQKEEDDDYYLNNREFANDVLNMVKGIDDRLSIKLKYNLSSIDMPEICSLIEEEDELDNELDEKQSENKWGLSNAFALAYQVLGETTSRGYERIRKKIELTLDSTLPSVYMLNKSLKSLQCKALKDETKSLKIASEDFLQRIENLYNF